MSSKKARRGDLHGQSHHLGRLRQKDGRFKASLSSTVHHVRKRWVAWRDHSGIKSTCCSCRRPWFPAPTGCSQPSLTLAPGTWCPFLMKLQGYQAHTWCTRIRAGKTHTHTYKWINQKHRGGKFAKRYDHINACQGVVKGHAEQSLNWTRRLQGQSPWALEATCKGVGCLEHLNFMYCVWIQCVFYNPELSSN